MNPLGLLKAAVAIMEIVVDTSKRKQKETRRERLSFVFTYVSLMVIGAMVILWLVHTLYFKK